MITFGIPANDPLAQAATKWQAYCIRHLIINRKQARVLAETMRRRKEMDKKYFSTKAQMVLDGANVSSV